MPLTDLDRMYISAFAGVSGIGRQTLKKIQEYQRSSARSWSELWQKNVENILTKQQSFELRRFRNLYTPESWQEYLHANTIEVLFAEDPLYPSLLQECQDRPEVLFARGELSVLRDLRLPISVVGTRKMTEYGEITTTQLVEQLSHCGATIVSGFMSGVDVAAHAAAQSVGGKTIAVLGYGVDKIYPAWLQETQNQFMQNGGVLLSEYPPGTLPRKGLFRLRNRIVAGMSWGTVVTQAGFPSGTFITVNNALEYGRTVFCVPAPPGSAVSLGCEELLRRGAIGITTPQEIFAELLPQLSPEEQALLVKGSAVEPARAIIPKSAQRVLQKIGTHSATTSELLDQTHMKFSTLMNILHSLEEQHLIVEEFGVWVRLLTRKYALNHRNKSILPPH